MRFFILAALLLGGSLSAQAATITVNSTADVVIANDGLCTLREAVTSANTDTISGPAAGECPAGAGDDVIQLSAGTYSLNLTTSQENDNVDGDLDITANLTITGAGPDVTIIERDVTSFGSDRLIHVLGLTYNATVTLAKLSLRKGIASFNSTGNGNFYGGGVLNDGSGQLILDWVTVGGVNFTNAAQAGGGIYSNGPLWIRNASRVCNNLAYGGGSGSAYGGGIF